MEEKKQNVSDATTDLLRDHTYDGIQEYDNPMPAWWTWLFVATGVFSVIYVLGIHVFDFVPTYEDDLAKGQAELEEIRAEYAATNPSVDFDEATIATLIDDPEQISAGAAQYATYCAVCHGDAGQGLIGPNLTDSYWIHGNTNEDLFDVITEGVVEKGMAAWSGVLTPDQRAQVVAFIRSLEGTNPPGAKDPQGDLYE